MKNILNFALVTVFCLIAFSVFASEDSTTVYKKNEIGLNFASFSYLGSSVGFNPSLIYKRLINKEIAFKTQFELENSIREPYWEQETEVYISNTVYKSWVDGSIFQRDIRLSLGIEARAKVLSTLSFTGGFDVFGLYQTSSSKTTEYVYRIDSIKNAGTIYQAYQKDLIEMNPISEHNYRGYGLGVGVNGGAIIHLHKKLLLTFQGRMVLYFDSGKFVTLDQINGTTIESPHNYYGFNFDVLYNKIGLFYCF